VSQALQDQPVPRGRLELQALPVLQDLKDHPGSPELPVLQDHRALLV